MGDKNNNALRWGIYVLLALAVLTALEFGASQLASAILLLFIIAILKAALILKYFMHISELWSEEDSH